MSDVQEQLLNLEQTRSFNSATNIVLNPQNEVLLGVLHEGVERQIPEGGDYVLIGGANGGLVPMPFNLEDLANAHLANIGIEVAPSQCSPFLPVEYRKEDVNGLLKTPFGVDSPVKRIAFDRVVQLTQTQTDAINMSPEGHAKIAKLVWRNASDFALIADSPYCSFPFQVEHVLQAFELKGYVPSAIGWK